LILDDDLRPRRGPAGMTAATVGNAARQVCRVAGDEARRDRARTAPMASTP
jgi:hypothetical protein